MAKIIPLTMSADLKSPSLHEEETRVATLMATVEHYIPDFVRGVEEVASGCPKMVYVKNLAGRSRLVRSPKMGWSAVLWGGIFANSKKRLVATSSAHSLCVISRRVFD